MKDKILHRDGCENQKCWPGAEKKDKGCRTKAQRCRIDLWREESLGEEGQPRGNTGKRNSFEGEVMPWTGTACQILVLPSF